MNDVGHWVVVAVIVFIVWRLVSPSFGASSTRICTACGTIGKTSQAPGSFLVEVGLWGIGFATLVFGIGLLVLLAALIYSLWRVASKQTVCPSCRTQTLITTDSPKGRELMAQYHADQAR